GLAQPQIPAVIRAVDPLLEVELTGGALEVLTVGQAGQHIGQGEGHVTRTFRVRDAPAGRGLFRRSRALQDGQTGMEVMIALRRIGDCTSQVRMVPHQVKYQEIASIALTCRSGCKERY